MHSEVTDDACGASRRAWRVLRPHKGPPAPDRPPLGPLSMALIALAEGTPEHARHLSRLRRAV